MSRRSSGQRGGNPSILNDVPSGIALTSTMSLLGAYGPYVAPIAGVLAAMTLNQVSQTVNIVKSVSKIFSSDTNSQVTILGAQQEKFEYQTGATKSRFSVSVWNVATILSLISLKINKIYPRRIPCINKMTPGVPVRKIALGYLSVRLLVFLTRLLWARFKSPIGATWSTKWIVAHKSLEDTSSSQKRQIFSGIPKVASKPVDNHTHGEAAAARNGGSSTAILVATSLGLEPYFIQQSLTDQRKGRTGDRSYHWAKDLPVTAKDFSFDPKKHVGIMNDVDYYVDVPNLLARFPGTYLFSTFTPSSTGKGSGQYTFRFMEDGCVDYVVSGGSMFYHTVWDYTGDTFVVEDVGLFTKTVISYHIDRKYLDADHSLLLFTVLARFEAPSLAPTDWFINVTRLHRLDVVRGNNCVLDVVKKDGMYRSLSAIGDHLSVTMLKTRLDAVRNVAIIAKVPITSSMVTSNISVSSAIGLPTSKLEPGVAALIAGHIRGLVPLSPPRVFPPSMGMKVVMFSKEDYEAPVPLAGFGSPIIGPCYSFPRSLASEDQCIVGRVEQFQNANDEEIMLPSVAGYMAEFVKFLIPEAHQGHPLDEDYVREKQDRPQQRAIIEEATNTGGTVLAMFRSMLKIETYGKSSTDPRNISMVTGKSKLEYSKMIYSFHNDVMKNQEWYAFAKTPVEIAERICEVLKSSAHSALADGHRFDGNIKRFARILERLCMLRHFAVEYHGDVCEAMDDQIGIPGVTTLGRRYASGYSRGSGVPETSDFNSLLTPFIGYCGWRNTLVDGKKCTPIQAWNNLGIYGGDDSLEGAVDPTALAKAASIMGQIYVVEVIPRGSVGVNFLNRQFGPDVWTGDPSSMANPARLLAKLFVGPAYLPNPLVRFGERASGYYRMDLNSPVVGLICQTAHLLIGEYSGGRLMPWFGKHTAEDNWPNQDSGWMMDVFNKFIPTFDHDRFTSWIKNVLVKGDAQLLLQAPLCVPEETEVPTVKVVAIVDDELLVPAAENPLGPKGKEEAYESIPDIVQDAMDKTPVCDDNQLKANKSTHKKTPVSKYSKDDPTTWTAPRVPNTAEGADTLKKWEQRRAKFTKMLLAKKP